MTTEEQKAPPPETSKRTLTVLAVLGVLAALWAVFLWRDLIDARRGGEAFCIFGESDCGLLWDAKFAGAVHRLTGLPVAAWGLVWGAAAFAAAVFARRALAERRGEKRALGAVRWTAAGGLAGVAVLLLASASEGLFCSSCALTYVLTVAYGAVALLVLKPRAAFGADGLGTAVMWAACVFLLLLYPGLQTPRSRASEDRKLLAGAAERSASAAKTTPEPASSMAASGGDPRLDQQLRELLTNSQPDLKLALSTALDLWRHGRYRKEPPRALRGSPDAPVVITEFTDSLCSHCAHLHDSLTQIENMVMPGTFSVDARHFPLDGNCNAKLPVRGPETVRCLAARAEICMEGSPHAEDFSGAIYNRQSELTDDLVYELAAPFMPRPKLEACVASSETAAKLASDVEYAGYFEPEGTPLVLINGREVSGLATVPFIYAMILAGGNPDHPLFATLPPPDLSAFQEPQDHEH